ncbi:hypothetical protein KY284_036606 [Solanum tuberosum]|nr:hypothetical protein KY284_036606 [Solanum tuberosum]
MTCKIEENREKGKGKGTGVVKLRFIGALSSSLELLVASNGENKGVLEVVVCLCAVVEDAGKWGCLVSLVFTSRLFGGRRAECSPELGGRWGFLWFGSLAEKS